MALQNAFVPHGAYWTTPFCRWQGSLAGRHSLELAGETARRFLAARGLASDAFDALHLGITVPQKSSFYGAPWLAALIGNDGITGPTISQACATSARTLAGAAREVEGGERDCILTVTCDRTSNGPHLYYPDPDGPGGTGTTEDAVLDNFNRDPHAGEAMIQTAENVAAAAGISRDEQEELTLLRDAQYRDALADDRGFQKRFMFPVELRRGKRVLGTIEEDEGIHATTGEGLAGLKPVLRDGTVTFGTQTHPADANAGMVVCDEAHARKLAVDEGVMIRLLAFGDARVEKGMMPKATVPAAQRALAKAGVGLDDCGAVKIHNPFAVGDVYFCREMGLAPDAVNRFGSPLVYGHPQAPMGMRVIIELIEELVARGGGRGLFSGCAGGDTAMALVVEVG